MDSNGNSLKQKILYTPVAYLSVIARERQSFSCSYHQLGHPTLPLNTNFFLLLLWLFSLSWTFTRSSLSLGPPEAHSPCTWSTETSGLWKVTVDPACQHFSAPEAEPVHAENYNCVAQLSCVSNLLTHQYLTLFNNSQCLLNRCSMYFRIDSCQ